MQSRNSASSQVNTACAIVCGSPAHLCAIGLAASVASAIATWFNGSSIDTGSPLWTLTASPMTLNSIAFAAPVKAPCMISVSASGAGASAMTAWMR